MANKATRLFNSLDKNSGVTNKGETTEEKLARLYGVNPLPTVSSPYKTLNVANMKNYIGEQTPQATLNPQAILNPQAELDKIMNYYGIGKTPGTTPLGTPSTPTAPSINTDYSRNKNQNINTPVAPGQIGTPVVPGQTDSPTSGTQDEFSKWYVDQQAKQDEINNEVVETIKKFYASKTEQEKSFYEQRIGLLQSQFQQNQQTLDRAQSRERQEANILHQRMMAYLPEQMNAQGLEGLGVSRSVIANAQNQLSSRLGGVNQEYNALRQQGNSEYQQNQMKLMQTYLSNQTDADQSYEEAMLKQYGNYADRTSALDTQQREERLLQEQYAKEDAQSLRDTLIQPNMQSLMEFNADGTIKEESYNNLRAYIDNLDLPNNLKTPLYTELDLYKNATPQNIGEKTELILVKNDAGKFKKNDTFHIKDANGNEYKLNSAGNVEDQAILDIAEEAYNVGELFVYGDKLYIKHKDGVAQVDTNRDYDKILKYLQ